MQSEQTVRRKQLTMNFLNYIKPCLVHISWYIHCILVWITMETLDNLASHDLNIFGYSFKEKLRFFSPKFKMKLTWNTDTRCKCKQDSVGVRRILVVPRDSGGASTGFCWCILSDKISKYLHSWSFCGKCYNWRIIEGLQLVMHGVVSHYQNYWHIFCGRSVLKRVRNVTGMVPWRRLVACYSCFML